jgi:hypothetical protein
MASNGFRKPRRSMRCKLIMQIIKQHSLIKQWIFIININSLSDDAQNWTLVVDKSKNDKDAPHDYVELTKSDKSALHQNGKYS